VKMPVRQQMQVSTVAATGAGYDSSTPQPDAPTRLLLRWTSRPAGAAVAPTLVGEIRAAFRRLGGATLLLPTVRLPAERPGA
jgi:hypothetical protein